MIQLVRLQVSPKQASDLQAIKHSIASTQKISISAIGEIRIIKRSIDARSRTIKIILDILFARKPDVTLPKREYSFCAKNVSHAPEVHIIGSGPAGLFAALRLIELGYKPIIFERGKDIHDRKRDIASLHKNEALNSHSNYCFGEGGAGTFSDGKLYTRSKKKEHISRVLELFICNGASEDIITDSHPHIGSDKLPYIIKNIRNSIIECGGELHFNTHVSEFNISHNKISALTLANNTVVPVSHVILATGHSAHDVYYNLHAAGIILEAKPSAMGVRAEHPQELIDYNQYHGQKTEYLPPASYSLVQQVENRGVYSFCMCPGGIIVPASSQDKQLVVNGMSNSQRNSPFANSGIAVQLLLEDYNDFAEYGPLAGLKFQEQLEQLAYNNGGNNQIAPAQAIGDFISGKLSPQLPDCSYLPGVVSSPLHIWLPEHIAKRLQIAFKAFNSRIRGYGSNEGIIVGVESRTSSPVRIPRNPETLQHIQIPNLYPCGEGAGYAGGISSSAVDGMLCAEAVARHI